MPKHIYDFDDGFVRSERCITRLFKMGFALWILWVLFLISLLAGGAYVAFHFISKHW